MIDPSVQETETLVAAPWKVLGVVGEVTLLCGRGFAAYVATPPAVCLAAQVLGGARYTAPDEVAWAPVVKDTMGTVQVVWIVVTLDEVVTVPFDGVHGTVTVC